MLSRYFTYPMAVALMAGAMTLASAPTASAQSADEQAVGEVIERLFDGMRAQDTAAIRSVFHEDSRLATTSSNDDGPVMRFVPIDDFIATVGGATDYLDERLGDVEIRVDDNLATAWMPYAFYLGEELSHCGVNAFQFVRTTDGWKVLQVADTRQQEGCEGR